MKIVWFDYNENRNKIPPYGSIVSLGGSIVSGPIVYVGGSIVLLGGSIVSGPIVYGGGSIVKLGGSIVSGPIVYVNKWE